MYINKMKAKLSVLKIYCLMQLSKLIPKKLQMIKLNFKTLILSVSAKAKGCAT